MDARGAASFAVMIMFALGALATSKPKSDDAPTATASAVAVAPSAPAAAPSAAPSAAPDPAAPKPPNPDHSCDPKNDTTCEFNETCVGSSKKGANGAGKCTASCPKGQAANPHGCSPKCTSDADCTKFKGPGSVTGCADCTKCKPLTQSAAGAYNPPRGNSCQP